MRTVKYSLNKNCVSEGKRFEVSDVSGGCEADDSHLLETVGAGDEM